MADPPEPGRKARRRARGRARGQGEVPPPATQAQITPPAPLPMSGSSGSSVSAETRDEGNDRPIGRGAVRPRREDKRVLMTLPDKMGPKKGTAGDSVTFTANYFQLKTNDAKWSICKHHVDVSPPEDRTFMKKILLRQHKERFHGYLFDGSTLFSLRNVCPDKKPLELVSQDREGKTYTLTVKFVGTVEKTDYQYLQVFNIILRECQAHLKLELMSRRYYDPTAKNTVPEYNLEIWPGYDTAVTQCENSVMLRVEITSKIVRRDTAYDILQECCRERAQSVQLAYNEAILGKIIITRYNNKTYRIDEVDYNTTPESSFSQTLRGEKRNVRYIDYFKERYNLIIHDLKQPMLISRSNAKARRAGQPELLYLVPELCTLTGMTDKMRNNFQLMKSVARYTQVEPGDRISRLNEFNKRLNSIPEIRVKLSSWGLNLNTNLIQIPGRILPAEKITVGDQRHFFMEKGSWDQHLRSSKMLHSVDIKKWIIIYPPRVGREANDFSQMLQKVASAMHYNIAAPRFSELASDRSGDYISTIDRIINEFHPQIVMCIVPNNRAERYNAIKRKCILEKPVPSQVMLSRTITSKGVMSIATKVAIQMNCKVGGVPWTVDIPFTELLTLGFDVCHQPGDRRLSYSAMVASLNTHCTQWYSNISRHSAGEEISNNFAMSVKMAVERFKTVNNDKLPKVILVFRDGVGEGQIEYVLNHEVQEMKAALKPMYEAAQQPLRTCFIIVTKRINTRFFFNGKNPPPGAIIDDVITDPHRFDFYLVSQSVRTGTVMPTHYNCIDNDALLKAEHVQRIAYKFTHLYYNWSGTVRVPAHCQYAHKLAFLAAQSLGKVHCNLDKFLYYL